MRKEFKYPFNTKKYILFKSGEVYKKVATGGNYTFYIAGKRFLRSINKMIKHW